MDDRKDEANMSKKLTALAAAIGLPLTVYPKQGGSALIAGAVIGILLALLLGIIAFFGFGIPMPFPMDLLTLLTAGGLCIAGNILCILQTLRQP